MKITLTIIALLLIIIIWLRVDYRIGLTKLRKTSRN